MSWIKENKFLAALAGGTLLGVILLLIVGLKGSGKYNDAEADFEASYSEASAYERIALYPRADLRDSKKKAIDDYRVALGSLQEAFEKYRPKELTNVSPQEFTTRLKSVDKELRAAFAESETTVPDAFFCGFEGYKDSLALGESTGILDYQLSGIRDLMLALSKSGVTELRNVHRPELPEERGEQYEPGKSGVARPLPLEITFTGRSKAVREFISSVVDASKNYVVIRSLRATNSKVDPPRASDAEFDEPVSIAPEPASGSIFGEGFDFGDDEGTEAADEGEPEAVEEESVEAPKSADSSRILYQVLGDEQVHVFLRLDFMQFLPAKELP